MKVDLARLNDILQLSAVALGALAAFAALGAYFTSGRLQAEFEAKVSQLEKEQAGRFLTQAQVEVLTSSLKAVPKPQEPLHLIGLQGNREAISLANTLKTTLQAAGFSVDGVWEDVIIGGTGPGILIRQKVADDPVGAGIAESLREAGLDVRVVACDTAKVEIIVAHKP